jgi:mannonate dehydratase
VNSQKHDANAGSGTSAFEPSRRDFGKMAVRGILGSALASGYARPIAAKSPVPAPVVHELKGPPGLKICAQMSAKPSDDDLLFLQQIGVEHCCVRDAGIPGNELNEILSSADGIREVVNRYASAGITLTYINNPKTHFMEDVALGLPSRDASIENFQNHLRLLSKAGVYTTQHNFGLFYRTARIQNRKAGVQEFNLAEFHQADPLSNGRVFTPDEMWKNYTYFIKKVAPVAEEVGVTIGFHPDDPPVPVLNGIPRLFSTFAGYKRAVEIADSPNVGLCCCCGTIIEAGQAFGKDPEGVIRYFAPQKKIFQVHFRNVSSPLPYFKETYPDNGYYNMYRIMKALRDTNCNTFMILDHAQNMVGGAYSYLAYDLAYMRGLWQAAVSESTKS